MPENKYSEAFISFLKILPIAAISSLLTIGFLKNRVEKQIKTDQLEKKEKVSKFSQVIEIVLENEGGYVNDPNDTGGETKYGISKAAFPTLDVKNATKDQAIEIYKKQIWERERYEEIEDIRIAAKIFDLVVNIGRFHAITVAQRACRSTGMQTLEDGKLGPLTLKAINESDPTDYLAAFKSEAAAYYRLLAQADPRRLRFFKGWLERAYK